MSEGVCASYSGSSSGDSSDSSGAGGYHRGMMRLARKAWSVPPGVLLPWLIGCSSAESESAHCAKLTAQIASELQSEVQRGTISSNAIACGQEGIVNHPDDFSSSTSQADVERITTQFANQCTDLSARCGGDADPGSP